MKWAYDFHIHTAASPCADESMTPNNIVNMCLLKGLDVIAVTDHQTVANCEAIIKVGKEKGLKVIAGMEIECMEEFHMIALFKNLQSAYEMESWLWKYIPHITNRPQIFGKQEKINSEDECVGEIERLLLVAAQVPAMDIAQKARALEALIYPAHIDRQSYSILSNLGQIPEDYGFKMLEVSKEASLEAYKKHYPTCHMIQSSDAHYLEQISERVNYIESECLSAYC